MIYNCKERFGYTYLWTSNKKMQGLLFAYCEGRSALWRMFLGCAQQETIRCSFGFRPARSMNF